MRHVTFVGNDGLTLPGEVTIETDKSATTTIANSVFADIGQPGCSGTVQSLGGNVGLDASCGAEHVVADAKLGEFGDHGDLVATVALGSGSPAVRAGVAGQCAAADARGDRRHVQERGGCDAGAYELGGGAGFLEQGGMNGIWFNAATDGHYVSVQRITPALALVT